MYVTKAFLKLTQVSYLYSWLTNSSLMFLSTMTLHTIEKQIMVWIIRSTGSLRLNCSQKWHKSDFSLCAYVTIFYIIVQITFNIIFLFLICVTFPCGPKT